MAFRRILPALATLSACLALPTPAWAVYILDTVWTADGGSEDDWGAGFDRAKALAADPAYDAVVGFWGQFAHDNHFGCSGTWLGNNQDDHAMILTAGHCIDDIPLNNWLYITTYGAEFGAVNGTTHPLYDYDDEETGGYDMAIIELDGPIEDIAEPAILYSGSDEIDYYIVTVGYGLRGPGNQADDRKFNTDNEKAAASNRVDAVSEPTEDPVGGNLLQSDFDAPNCDYSTLGEDCPVDDYEGMMAKGDSGGPGFIETEEGMRLAGISAESDIRYGYGMIGGHARVSTQLYWILSVFPDALYGE